MAQLHQKDGFKIDSVLRKLVRSPRLFLLLALCGLVVLISVAGGVVMGSKNSVTIDRTSSSVETAGDSVPVSDSSDSDIETESKSNDTGTTGDEVVVDVSGAVVVPSVVHLSSGDRIDDAITACGGLSDDADIDGVNRASVLVDGQKVYIPHRGESQTPVTADAGQIGSASSVDLSVNSSGLVNINTASLDELQTLSGVGPSTAQAIIDERTQNGAFASVDDLMRVSGIGERKLAKIKDAICV